MKSLIALSFLLLATTGAFGQASVLIPIVNFDVDSGEYEVEVHVNGDCATLLTVLTVEARPASPPNAPWTDITDPNNMTSNGQGVMIGVAGNAGTLDLRGTSWEVRITYFGCSGLTQVTGVFGFSGS